MIEVIALDGARRGPVERSGVPAYALYAPGQSQPRLLPEVLTPGIVTGAIAQLPHANAQ